MAVRAQATPASPAAAGVTIGTSVITGGTNTRVLFDDSGVIGESGGLTYTKANGLLAPTLLTVGGNALILGAALTTTGAGAPTLAFSGTGRTYTFPDASVTLLSTGGAILNVNPSNPTGTTSTAGVMAGIGVTTCRVTPLYSTRMSITVMGSYGNNTNADGIGVSIRFGTGAGPANGAAATGTSISGSATYNPVSAANNFIPFSLTGYATGLTPGTAIWIDLLVAAVTGGTATVANITCLANEF